jgi:hypothetical protein
LAQSTGLLDQRITGTGDQWFLHAFIVNDYPPVATINLKILGKPMQNKLARKNLRASLFLSILKLYARQARINLAKGITDHRAQEHQCCNNNDGYQNQNQSIFNKSLTLFFFEEQHRTHLLSI